MDLGRGTKWITVQDSEVLEMVSLLTGGRRAPFNYLGQLALTQRVYAEKTRHAFNVQSRVPGPNVFLHSSSNIDYGASEPHHRWSVGGLYDNVDATIYIQDRGWLGTGQGWSGANYVAWNTKGSLIVQAPPTAQNYSIGHVGVRDNPFLPNNDDTRPRSEGFWDREGTHVEPASLYLQQLADRLGTGAVSNIAPRPVGGTELDRVQQCNAHGLRI